MPHGRAVRARVHHGISAPPHGPTRVRRLSGIKPHRLTPNRLANTVELNVQLRTEAEMLPGLCTGDGPTHQRLQC